MDPLRVTVMPGQTAPLGIEIDAVVYIVSDLVNRDTLSSDLILVLPFAGRSLSLSAPWISSIHFGDSVLWSRVQAPCTSCAHRPPSFSPFVPYRLTIRLGLDTIWIWIRTPWKTLLLYAFPSHGSRVRVRVKG